MKQKIREISTNGLSSLFEEMDHAFASRRELTDEAKGDEAKRVIVLYGAAAELMDDPFPRLSALPLSAPRAFPPRSNPRIAALARSVAKSRSIGISRPWREVDQEVERGVDMMRFDFP